MERARKSFLEYVSIRLTERCQDGGHDSWKSGSQLAGGGERQAKWAITYGVSDKHVRCCVRVTQFQMLSRRALQKRTTKWDRATRQAASLGKIPIASGVSIE
jgi:hypothetical protein